MPEIQEQDIQIKRKRTIDLATEVKNLQRIRAIECINSLYQFFIEFWDVTTNDELVNNWHIEKVCNELQEVGMRIARGDKSAYDLIINIPPGTSKSTMVSVVFPIWLWLHKPDAVIISSSYSGGLSIDHSSKSKDIFKHERFQAYFQPIFYQKYGKYMVLVKDTEKFWRNNFGGSRITTSTGGTITGKHGHLILRDDPINPEQAESKAYRDKANRFNDRTLSNRKKDKSKTPIVTVMQRLHDNDTTGNELSKKGKSIRHVCLPAELSKFVSPAEYREFYKDGLLDSSRLSREILKDEKTNLGSFGYAGQYGQTPSPEGGGQIKHEWWVKIEESELPVGLVWDLWLDGAYTKNTDNDPTGFMVAAYHKQHNRMYIRHYKSEYMEMPALLKDIKKYCKDYGINGRSKLYIEPKASGHSLKQMINDEVTELNAVLIKGHLVSDGKEARLAVASPRVESGKVYLVTDNWNETFVTEIGGFPKASHDESVDLIGYSCDQYFGHPAKKGVKRTN